MKEDLKIIALIIPIMLSVFFGAALVTALFVKLVIYFVNLL